ncbi:hypothetical protein A3Q56_03636 [Intoshia linei]|uniref:Transcription factor 25 n=1 Tax=Intoshia linei TaxID=1819745 RepID=A0A177B2W8_9BILA|nr:hypothetical protein A3Q56_03636 [Intoshia linei]
MSSRQCKKFGQIDELNELEKLAKSLEIDNEPEFDKCTLKKSKFTIDQIEEIDYSSDSIELNEKLGINEPSTSMEPGSNRRRTKKKKKKLKVHDPIFTFTPIESKKIEKFVIDDLLKLNSDHLYPRDELCQDVHTVIHNIQPWRLKLRQMNQRKGINSKKFSLVRTDRLELARSINCNITLKCLKNNYYQFCYNKNYIDIMEEYQNALLTTDKNINELVKNFNKCAEIALHTIAAFSLDPAEKYRTLDMVLYMFESSFVKGFSPANVSNRLSFDWQPNRTYFLTLLCRIKMAHDMKCFPVSLELCKYVLSLNPIDPLGVMMMIDYYMLITKNYSFMLKFQEKFAVSKRIHLFPNWAYSLSFCYFKAQNFEKADKLLCQAILMFPSFIHLLLDICNVNPDNYVEFHSYLSHKSKKMKVSEGFKTLIEAYVRRTNILWKEKVVLEWIEKNVKLVLAKIDNRDPDTMKQVDAYQFTRQNIFKSCPNWITRNLMIMDEKLAKIPTSLTFISLNPLSLNIPHMTSTGSNSNNDNEKLYLDQDASFTKYILSFISSINPMSNPHDEPILLKVIHALVNEFNIFTKTISSPGSSENELEEID